jgi:nucleotide-binding universal stress UspA family protein
MRIVLRVEGGMAAQVGPVVVGTDFSEPARVALAEARRLAKLLRTELHVVHVIDGNPSMSWRNEGEADGWLREACLEPADLKVRFGGPWIELARYVAEVAPVFLVIGSHGRSGYQPLAIGSTAARVTVHARCPVVLVSPRVASANEGSGLKTGREAAAVSARNEPG